MKSQTKPVSENDDFQSDERDEIDGDSDDNLGLLNTGQMMICPNCKKEMTLAEAPGHTV